MKKFIAMLLIAIMVMSFAACGSVNDTEVSILWSGDGEVHVPNSLINALERAMYIDKVEYAHYGANGSQETQTKQANDALNAGCAALVVELVDASAAQTIVDAAKAKNVPVIFVNTPVDEAVVKSYDKCVSVVSDLDSVGEVLGGKIFEDLEGNKEKGKEPKIENYDRNADGKLSCIVIGDLTVSYEGLPLEVISGDVTALKEEARTVEEKVFFFFKKTTEYGDLKNADGTPVELILVDNDATAHEVLKQLREYGFNDTKLTTHCIPVYTVGNEADAKGFKNSEDYEAEEWEALIYTTADLIGSGWITGAAVTDYDGCAAKVSGAVKSLLKGETVEQIIKVPYTTN